MIRRAVMLGRSAITRRVLATVILLGGAVGGSYWREDWSWDWFDLGTHLVLALGALIYLHYRWRAQERRAITPEKVKDVFS